MVYSILTVWNASTVPLQILPILQSLIQILSLQEDSFDPIQISPCCSWFLLVLESFNNSTPHILGPIWSVYVLSPQFPEDRDHSVCFPRSSLWCLAAHSVLVLCIQMIFHVTCTALAEYPLFQTVSDSHSSGPVTPLKYCHQKAAKLVWDKHWGWVCWYMCVWWMQTCYANSKPGWALWCKNLLVKNTIYKRFSYGMLYITFYKHTFFKPKATISCKNHIYKHNYLKKLNHLARTRQSTWWSDEKAKPVTGNISTHSSLCCDLLYGLSKNLKLTILISTLEQISLKSFTVTMLDKII